MDQRSFWLMFAVGQVMNAGRTIRLIDTNRTGRDDLIGFILETSGEGFQKYLQGDMKGTDKALLAVADAIYTAQGLELPERNVPARREAVNAMKWAICRTCQPPRVVLIDEKVNRRGYICTVCIDRVVKRIQRQEMFKEGRRLSHGQAYDAQNH